jgi:uncharacterized DUF497 family protein
MIFEWDETKREINRGKHKLDLIDGQYLFDGRPLSPIHPRAAVRHASFTVGLVGRKFYAVVWTERGGAIRLISFRRARDGEERAYRARFG